MISKTLPEILNYQKNKVKNNKADFILYRKLGYDMITINCSSAIISVIFTSWLNSGLLSWCKTGVLILVANIEPLS